MESVANDFLDVTEMAGEPISAEQLDRLNHRYTWAARRCTGKVVVELACGSGAGLGLLQKASLAFEAADCSGAMLDRVRRHYGQRIELCQFDAESMPYADRSKDVLVLFEAIYYLPSVANFARECRRVLRPGGILLIVSANKDLPDFNASPHSCRYLGVVEMQRELSLEGFDAQFSGYMDVAATSFRQRLLRPVKRMAVASGLMPKTMRGKQLLKRLVFGQSVLMPAELLDSMAAFVDPMSLRGDIPDRSHKVIYCEATVARE